MDGFSRLPSSWKGLFSGAMLAVGGGQFEFLV